MCYSLVVEETPDVTGFVKQEWYKLNMGIRGKVVISILLVRVGAFLCILKSSGQFLDIFSPLQGSLHWNGPQNTAQPSLCIEHYFSDVLGSSC